MISLGYNHVSNNKNVSKKNNLNYRHIFKKGMINIKLNLIKFNITGMKTYILSKRKEPLECIAHATVYNH